jgi:hypothetical protein
MILPLPEFLLKRLSQEKKIRLVQELLSQLEKIRPLTKARLNEDAGYY